MQERFRRERQLVRLVEDAELEAGRVGRVLICRKSKERTLLEDRLISDPTRPVTEPMNRNTEQ